jgi:hypothetical protein
MATAKRASATKTTDMGLRVVVSFERDKETKNTVRFAEIDENGERIPVAEGVIGNLYVKKHIAVDWNTLTVTLQGS